MKKLLFVILFFISQPGVIYSFDPEEMMLKGNSFYQQKDYARAIDSYEKILGEGFASEALYYNLGNAYYKTDKLGYAILNYEKALRLDPSDEDARFNLQIASARTVDKIEELPKLFFVEWWESFVNLFSISGWTIITYIFYLLSLGGVVVYFFAGNVSLQKWGLLSCLGTGVLFVVTLLLLVTKINNDTGIKYGVVVEQVVTVKSSPDETSNDVFIIHEGIRVNLEDEVGSWVKVRLADGKVGWLSESDLRII